MFSLKMYLLLINSLIIFSERLVICEDTDQILILVTLWTDGKSLSPVYSPQFVFHVKTVFDAVMTLNIGTAVHEPIVLSPDYDLGLLLISHYLHMPM